MESISEKIRYSLFYRIRDRSLRREVFTAWECPFYQGEFRQRHRQSSDITYSGYQWQQAPFRCCELISFEACKPRRFPWEKRYLQLVERKGKTISGCLDIGFLTRPILKEAFRSQRRIDAEQIFALARCKAPHGNRLKLRQVSNEFKIDPQITIPRDREDSVAFGMRQIKMQCWRS